MELLKSYLDANLILNAFSEDEAIAKKVMRILTDPERDLMVGDYVELETLPKMRYFKKAKQLEFAESVFRRAIYVRSNAAIIHLAHELADTYGLAAMDALHAASAIEGGADELLTFEKPSKPFFRIPPDVLRVTSLHGA